jgi:hypothetical protein
MSVQDAVRTVTIPQQAGPADPPLAARPPAPRAGVPGHARPLTSDEKQFILGASITFGGLAVIIVTFLLLSVYAW